MLKKVLKGLGFVGLLFLVGTLVVQAPNLHEQYLYNKASTQIVRIVSAKGHNHGGTGFSVKAESGTTYVLTNRHVCLGVRGDDGTVTANLPDDSERFYKLSIKEISATTDLCLLEGIPGRSGIPLAGSAGIGEHVEVIGHPHLNSTTLTHGMITNFQTIQVIVGQEMNEEQCTEAGGTNQEMVGLLFGIIPVKEIICVAIVNSVRIGAQIYPGNSGSPVVNIWGNVTGVLFAGDDAGSAFMIPLQDVREFLSNR